MKKRLILLIILLLPFKIKAITFAPVDITNLNIKQLQDAVDKGYLTYELLTRLYLERIEAYDDDYNVIISINEKAIEEAKEKDIYYKKYGRPSLLFGIPIIVKDNIDVKGMPTTLGTKSLKDNYPNDDAQIIKNLKEKGVIILAKANMSEFAFMADSSESSYGTTNNAYDKRYSSYGSSGGSAVSVALKYAPLAIGTDTNSSLRAPASAAFVIGFRPTLNKLSTTGIIPYNITRDVPGPVTTNLYDNALVMAALENKEDDFYIKNMTNKDFSDITIGVIDDFAYGNDSGIYGTGKTYDKLITLFDDTLKKLEKKGAKIVHINHFYNQTYNEINQTAQGGWTMCYFFNQYIQNTTGTIRSFEQLAKDPYHIYSLDDYVEECSRDIKEIETFASQKRPYKQYVENIYDKYALDVLVYPTTKNKLSLAGENNFESASYTIAPVLGLPAVSMPLGFIDGLPYGIEFVALKDNEQKLYEILYNYEKINNVYTLPKEAKNLYEIPINVEKLKKIYEKNNDLFLNFLPSKMINDYQGNIDAIKNFFHNYSQYNIEEINTLSHELYRKLDKSLTNINIIYIYSFLNIIKIILLKIIVKKFI